MNEPYYTTFERYIRDNYGTCKNFCRYTKISQSSISNWVRGNSFPTPNYIKQIWAITKDEIGPMYWYREYPTEVKLKRAYIKKKAAELDGPDG